MATYYMTQNGNGSADGSSLENAMSVTTHNGMTFSEGDIINVSGTITSSILPPSSGSDGHPIIYDGNEGEATYGTTLLQGVNTTEAHYPIRIDTKDYIDIRNFKADKGETIVLIVDSSNYINVYNNFIENASFQGIKAGTTTSQEEDGCSNISIYNNEIYNCGYGTAGADIGATYVTTMLVANNHLWADKTDMGIDGFGFIGCSNVIIEYNEIHGHNDSETEQPSGVFESSGNIGGGEDGIDIKEGNHDIIIRYNKIYNHNYQANITVQRGCYNVEIYGNEISNSRDGGVFVAEGSGGYGFPHNVHIHHNIFYDEQNEGVAVTGGYGMIVENNIFINNTISPRDNNSASLKVYGDPNPEPNHLIKNNIFINNKSLENNKKQCTITAGAEDGTTLINNLYFYMDETPMIEWGWNNDVSAISIDTDAIIADPLFEDEIDYKLSISS